jgi:uncharacterized membrane protein
VSSKAETIRLARPNDELRVIVKIKFIHILHRIKNVYQWNSIHIPGRLDEILKWKGRKRDGRHSPATFDFSAEKRNLENFFSWHHPFRFEFL